MNNSNTGSKETINLVVSFVQLAAISLDDEGYHIHDDRW